MKYGIRKQDIRLYCFIVIFMISGFAIGCLFSFQPETDNHLYPQTKLSMILDAVSESYVDSVDIDELRELSVYYFISQLDPHSYYLPFNDNEDNINYGEPLERGGVDIYLADSEQ